MRFHRFNALWWWIDRWRKSTAYTDMTLEEQGAYRNLLDEATLRGGALPNDERILAKACGDATKWRAVRHAVLAHFEVRKDGLHNPTLDTVLKESVNRAERQARYRERHAGGEVDDEEAGEGAVVHNDAHNELDNEGRNEEGHAGHNDDRNAGHNEERHQDHNDPRYIGSYPDLITGSGSGSGPDTPPNPPYLLSQTGGEAPARLKTGNGRRGPRKTARAKQREDAFRAAVLGGLKGDGTLKPGRGR